MWLLRLLLVATFAPPSGSIQTDTHFNVKDYGAIGDGKTDDTRAVQTCIDAASNATQIISLPTWHDAIVARTSVIFPSGHYLLSSTLNLNRRPPDLLGVARPLLHMNNSAKDIVFGSYVHQWKVSSLSFFGGRNHLHIGNNNTDKGQILIDDCSFLNANGAAVRLLEPSEENWPSTVGKQKSRRSSPHHTLEKFGGSFSSAVNVQRCVFNGCNQALINWADWTTVEKCWVTSSTFQDVDTAVFENHDRLFLRDILAVPRETNGTAASRQRWVDNYAYRYDGGRVALHQFRFGGEGSGLGAVYNFAPFACQLVQSKYSHMDLCGRVPHNASAVPANVSLVPGSAITITGSQIDTHHNPILYMAEVPAHVELSGCELRDGSGKGTLVFNVTDTIDLSSPVYHELLGRASGDDTGRQWLSYNIGKSNWNGPTQYGGGLPKELLPFEY